MKQKLLITITALLSIAACDSADDAYRVVGELASDRIELTAESSEPIVEPSDKAFIYQI